MFSPTRMAQCKVSITDYSGPQPEVLRLSKHLHIVWINLLKRARPAVIRQAAHKFCAESRDAGKTPDIRMSLTCAHPDSVLRGICKNARDADQDGVPDGYADSALCDGQDPKACYRADCGDDSVERCYERLCRVQVVTADENQCRGTP